MNRFRIDDLVYISKVKTRLTYENIIKTKIEFGRIVKLKPDGTATVRMDKINRQFYINERLLEPYAKNINDIIDNM